MAVLNTTTLADWRLLCSKTVEWWTKCTRSTLSILYTHIHPHTYTLTHHCQQSHCHQLDKVSNRSRSQKPAGLHNKVNVKCDSEWENDRWIWYNATLFPLPTCVQWRNQKSDVYRQLNVMKFRWTITENDKGFVFLSTKKFKSCIIWL